MKDDHLHVRRKRRRRPIGLACDNSVGVNGLAPPDNSRKKLRHVVPDIELAEVRRQPAPTLHIDEDAAQADGPVLAPRLGACGRVRPAQLQKQPPQRLELLVLGMQRPQVGVWGIAGGDVRENVGGSAHGRPVIQHLGDARKIAEPSAARVAGVLEHGKGQRHLGCGRCLRSVGSGMQLRQGEIAGAQPRIVGLADLVDDGFAPLRDPGLRDPQQRPTVRIIEGGRGRQILGIGGRDVGSTGHFGQLLAQGDLRRGGRSAHEIAQRCPRRRCARQIQRETKAEPDGSDDRYDPTPKSHDIAPEFRLRLPATPTSASATGFAEPSMA